MGSDAQRRALEAKAVQETLPLLDGVLGGSAATAATASAACNCLGALCTGSSALAAELREMGALTSLVGLLASKVAPNGLKTNACEALAAAGDVSVTLVHASAFDEMVGLGPRAHNTIEVRLSSEG